MKGKLARKGYEKEETEDALEQLQRSDYQNDERFADVLKACAEAPQHAADLLMVLFRRKLDLHQTTFAMGESVAHLHAHGVVRPFFGP